MYAASCAYLAWSSKFCRSSCQGDVALFCMPLCQKPSRIILHHSLELVLSWKPRYQITWCEMDPYLGERNTSKWFQMCQSCQEGNGKSSIKRKDLFVLDQEVADAPTCSEGLWRVRGKDGDNLSHPNWVTLEPRQINFTQLIFQVVYNKLSSRQTKLGAIVLRKDLLLPNDHWVVKKNMNASAVKAARWLRWTSHL